MRIKKGKWTREGKKRKKTKAHPGGSGTAIGVIQMDGLKTGKLGDALGGAGSVLPFFRRYVPSCTQKRHFIYWALRPQGQGLSHYESFTL